MYTQTRIAAENLERNLAWGMETAVETQNAKDRPLNRAESLASSLPV